MACLNERQTLLEEAVLRDRWQPRRGKGRRLELPPCGRSRGSAFAPKEKLWRQKPPFHRFPEHSRTFSYRTDRRFWKVRERSHVIEIGSEGPDWRREKGQCTETDRG